MQFSQLCQMDLFPLLEAQTGEQSRQVKFLAEGIALLQLNRFDHNQWRERPREDRKALVAAFLEKSRYNLATVRHIDYGERASNRCTDFHPFPSPINFVHFSSVYQSTVI